MTTATLGSILIAAAVRQELAAFRASDVSVLCVTTGMGARAGDSVRRFLGRQPVSLVVSTGFAGGARPGLRSGELVVASEVVEEFSGRRFRPTGSAAVRGSARVGPFVTVPRVLAAPQDKQERGVRFSALAVEMETAAVARAAEEAGVPWMAVRVILDPMEVPVTAGSFRQAVGLAARPWRWPELAQFVGDVRSAGESLGRELELLVEQMRS